MWFNSKGRKSFDLGLKENIACKEDILKEYKGIRHEYNNMLQSVVCFIEEEDWKGLKEYKDRLLRKTQLLNANNFTQLVKLKNRSVLSLVYRLLIRGKKSGTILHLIIYNDIDDREFYKIPLFNLLEGYFNNAYDVAAKLSGEVNLKICGNNEGVRFVFENTYDIKDFNNISELIKIKIKRKPKNIYFNTFIETDRFIQEILVLAI